MECKRFTYTRATDRLLYDCIDACEAAYFSDASNYSVTRTSGEWTIFAISGTWFSTPERIRDFVRLDVAVAAELVDNIRTHPFYRAVRQAVLDTIRSDPDVRLALTGHSAGGCVASLVAAEVHTLCTCTCIVLNPFLNTSIVQSLLASAIEVAMFFTVEDITVPLIRGAIPLMETRGWIRWVIPNFRDAEHLPIHIIAGNFQGRDPIEAFSTVPGCLVAETWSLLHGTEGRSGRVRAAALVAVGASVAVVAYHRGFFSRT